MTYGRPTVPGGRHPREPRHSRESGNPASFWQRRIRDPILAQLKQGITPEKIALTLALGGVLGIFPLLGACTVLCAGAGIALRLNQPIIQLVNYLMYPLQILLLIPFYRAGEWLFNAPPVPIADVGEIVRRFTAGPWQFVLDYGLVALYGIVVWLILAPAVGAIAYLVLKPVLVAASRKIRR